jgi:type I restriction enzyme S subunit
MAESKTLSTSAEQLITEHLDIWTTAIEQKSSSGRGSSKKFSLHGIKKLRELILELAVRGKLVPQDPTDEPASVLLEKIQAKKEQLIQDGILKKLKKAKVHEAILTGENIPIGWEAVDFGDITFNLDAKRIPLSVTERKGREGDYDYYGASGVIDSIDDYLFDKPLLLIGEDGANLVNRSTPIAFMARGKYWVNNHAHVIDGISEDFLIYLSLYINSISLIPYITGMAQPKMNQAKMNAILVLLPPEKEQRKIISKVDELMSLCDALEAQTENSITAHQTLVEVLLAALLKAPEQHTTPEQATAQFQQNWQRLSEHFDTLFTTTASIDTLKQTILQLAVMGKLVPQNPDDEPAAKLLQRIAAEKDQLIKDKKIKKQKPLPEITDEEKPFELPDGWEWSKLDNISILKGGFAYKSNMFVEGSNAQVIRMGNIRPDTFRFEANPVFISHELAEKTSEYEIISDDILLTMTGTNGKRDYLYSLVVSESDVKDKRLFLNQRLCISRMLNVDSSYTNVVLKDDRLLDAIYSKSTGTANQANIGMEAIKNWVIPIAPLEEQHRIVAKVNELMTLCDQLKARITEAQTTKLHLTDAIVEQAV